jgi:hypothetical protein
MLIALERLLPINFYQFVKLICLVNVLLCYWLHTVAIIKHFFNTSAEQMEIIIESFLHDRSIELLDQFCN